MTSDVPIFDWFAPGRYHHPNTTTQEGPVSLLTAIEDELHNVGHEVSDVLHGVLSKHLTLSNIAAHLAQGAAVVEADPVVRAVEKALLPPGAQQVIAGFVEDLGVFLGSQDTPQNAPAVTTPAPAEAVPAA